MKRIASRGFGDFVGAQFSEPMNPIAAVAVNWDPHPGMGRVGDFVAARFSEPENPIDPRGMGAITPNFGRSLEHAAAIALDRRRGFSGCGGGCGGECGGGCSGMGAIAEPAWTANLPTFLQGSALGLPKVYLLGGAILAAVAVPMMMGGGGRRGRR